MSVKDPSADLTKPANARPCRRWFRFRLRTLLIFTVVLSVLFGWLGSVLVRARNQRRIVEQLEALNAIVNYDYELTGGKTRNPPWPHWLTEIFGEDTFAYVERVQTGPLSRVSDKNLVLLSELDRLTYVELTGPTIEVDPDCWTGLGCE